MKQLPLSTGQSSVEAAIEAAVPIKLSKREVQLTSCEWTDALVRSELGNNIVDVYVSTTRRFPGGMGPYESGTERVIAMTIAELLDRINGEREPVIAQGEHYYAYQVPSRRIERFEAYFSLPSAIPSEFRARSSMCFWLGNEGNVTPAHTDGTVSNILVQVFGRKRFRLWSPEKADEIGLRPYGQPHSRQTDKLPEELPHADFEATVQPGEAIYIPDAWIHEVTSVDVCCSVNCFFAPRPEFSERFNSFVSAIRCLSSPVRQQQLWLLGWSDKMLHDVDPRDWSGDGK